jgi:hypothetical protein
VAGWPERCSDSGRQQEDAMDEKTLETAQGYVVDIACLRKYPREELLARARAHTRECALMGHCVESGYGLVDNDGRMTLLEAAATPQVVSALERSGRERGIQLRAERERDGEALRTRRVLPLE